MEGTIAEIRMFAGNFAPRGWFFCQGQILSIAQNTAFFSFNTSRITGKSAVTIARPAAMYSNIFIGLATLAESAVPLEPMMERL